jgi:hypothetical protein
MRDRSRRARLQSSQGLMRGERLTRRSFLGRGVAAGIAWPLAHTLPDLRRLAAPEPTRPLLARFPDLPRHFVFEYYPWYGAAPFRHWDEAGRVPPDDLASAYYPQLGAYDSRERRVLEQHARSISDSGAGAINVSWWGAGSYEDRAVPLLMDVMRDHDLKVTFHVEPHSQDHGRRFAEDVLYLVREYGDRRGYDALLLLQDEDGTRGPVFKGFRTILPAEATDCNGVTRPVPDYTPDDEWRQQLDGLRETLSRDFDHVTLLADTVNVARASRSGFDGIAVYDNYVPPESYAAWALAASSLGLLFSFNVNPGFDAILPRHAKPDPCFVPPPFAPPAGELDWTQAAERERAAGLSAERIAAAFDATLAAQTDPGLENARRGFLLAYLNSFNEWHEGHAFEPMRDAALLTPAQRVRGYHNPARGDYRIALLREKLMAALAPERSPRQPSALARAPR